MSLDLSTLVFKTETSELERASKALGDVVTNMVNLDKAAQTSARTEATLAKAAKDSAKANLDNAKAQQVNAKAAEATEQAQIKVSAAAEKSNSILQRQTDIYDFMTQGFSKGQSNILASAKATGQLSEELKRVLDEMKAFETSPFDKSELGLKRLQKTMKEVVAAQGFFNEGSNLTTKQARELSNDLDRVAASLTRQGKSYQDITKAQALHKQEFIEEAAAVNRAQNALDIVTKQRKEVATATNYLTQADQKLAAALNMSNVSLDKAGTDSLVKYENALRKSGLAQDAVTQKLATYKSQLTQVQAQEAKKAEQHLARALSPQLTDIGVSLYSGQSPMTVLLQQGGQIADLLRLSGVEAGNFGKSLRSAFASMIPVMATVAKGLGGFFFGLFYDAGKGITKFIGNVTNLNKVMDDADRILYLVGGRAVWFSKLLQGAGVLASAVFGGAILAAVVALGALTVGMKQAITENNDLAKAFALSGASIGLSHAQVVGYVKTLSESGATTGQATEALMAMAKAGTFTSNEILLVSESAIQMQKGFGIAIEDTVKEFAKLKEKPVEALLEIAKSSGMVGPEIIKMVMELEQAGKTTDAASLAMKSYAEVNKEKLSQMKEDYNGFSLFIIKLGGSIKQFFSDAFKTLFLAADPNQQLEDQLKGVRERIKEVSGNLKDLGSFGDPKLLNSLKEQERMLISQIGATVRLQGEEDKRKAANAENARYEEAALKLRKDALSSIEKETQKTQTLAEFRKSFVETKLKEAAKEKAVDVEKLRLNTELITLLEKQAGIEFKKNQPKKGTKLSVSPWDKSVISEYAKAMEQIEVVFVNASEKSDHLSKTQKVLLAIQSSPQWGQFNRQMQEQIIYSASLAQAKEDEADANKNLVQSLREQYAAQSSLDTQRLTQSRELSGAGLGTAERSRLTGRNQKEDQFSLQLRNLEETKSIAEASGTFDSDAQNKYSKELERIRQFKDASLSEYDAYYAERLKQEGDWSVGASEALKNYQSEIENIAKSTENLFTKAFKGMEDALVNFIKTGKLDFESLADSIITDLIRIQVQQSITVPLSKGVGDVITLLTKGFASGGSFNQSGVQAFANGGTFTNQIVNQPTLFKFAKGIGMMGEAGAEAIMPLTRGSDGKLGVQASGSQQPAQNINITINATVGDVASKADVVAGMKATANQIKQQFVRSQNYGGAIA